MAIATMERIAGLVSRFWTKTVKALRTGITVNFFGAAENTKQSRSRDFKSYLTGLMLSEWTMVAMMRISDAIIFHDWKIVDKEGNKIEDETDLAVSIFRRPNPQQTWVDFIEMILWFWLPVGNAFIWLRPSLFDPKVPAELHILWPTKVTIVPTENGLSIKHYEVVFGDATKTWIIPVEQMLLIRFGNPLRRHWGLGRLEASERTYDMDIAAADYAYRFFEADGTPGGVLSTPKRLHRDTKRDLKEQWKERHQGKDRAHNWTILEEGLEWKNPAPGPREAQFLETRKATREVILGLFGVSPLKAGITEGSNRATAFVQERSWQRDTIAPLLKRLNIFLSTISTRFGDRFFQFEELVQEDNVEDTTIATGYFNVGAITPNEIREHYAGLPRIEDNPAMDLTYLPVSVIPTGETPPPVGFSIDPSKPGAPAGEAEPSASTAAGNGHAKQGRRGTPLQQRVLQSFRKQQLVEQRRMKREIAAFFRSQGDKVVERFLHGKAVGLIDTASKYMIAKNYGEALVHATKGLEDAFDLAADEQAWMRVARSFFSEGLQEEFNVTASLLGHEPAVPFEPGDVRFDQRMRQLTGGVSRTSEATKAGLDESIRRGLELGLGPTQIAEGAPELGYPGIRGTFDEFSRSRAQLIARTESSRVLDQANTETYRQLGVTVCDVIGCEDNVIMPGQKYGCNSTNIPMADAESIEFHPNHKGAIVPRITSPRRIMAAFDTRRAGVA